MKIRTYKRPDMKGLFDELNLTHFGGEVPDVRLDWSRRLTTTAGKCRFRRRSGVLTPTSISLSDKLFSSLDYDLDKITRTLTHEMVHAFLYHKYNERGHTLRFHRIMTEITGADINHRCHNYDSDGVKHFLGQCRRCEQTFRRRSRMPRGTLKHRHCGGAIVYIRSPSRTSALSMESEQ